MQDDRLLHLDEQFCFAIYTASRRVQREYTELLKPLDLTYPQYLVMLVLWEWAQVKHERPTVTALGHRLRLDNGTLTPLLRRLETKGMIARTRQATDEREVFLTLTRSGSALKRKARRVPLKALESSPMSRNELLQLRDQLKRLAA